MTIEQTGTDSAQLSGAAPTPVPARFSAALAKVAFPEVLVPQGDDAAAEAPGAGAADQGAAPAEKEQAGVAEKTAADQGAPAPEAPRRGLAARLGALFGRCGRATAPGAGAVDRGAPSSEPASAAITVAADGSALVAPGARVEALPRLAGQSDDAAYILSDCLPLPPGAGVYLLEVPADELGRLTGAPAATAPAGACEPAGPSAPAPEPAAPVSASIVAYLDAYGRAFSCGSVQAAPPARVPDVQFARYGAAQRRGRFDGAVEVAVSKGKLVCLAEYTEGPGGFSLGGTRADFGFEPAGLSLAQACAVAFLALWLFPRRAGVELATVSVKDVLEHLRTSDLFEAIDRFAGDVRQGAAHPLLAPPGVLSYFEEHLRAAGLVGLKAADLAARGGSGAPSMLSAMGSLLTGLPIVASGTASGGPLPEGVTTVHASIPAGGDIVASIQRALADAGITGLTFAGGTGPDGEQIAAPPSVRLIRTSSYANLFYASFDRRQVSAEGARKLLEAEALLNRLVLVVEQLNRVGAVQSAAPEQVAEVDAWVVDHIACLADPYLDGTAGDFERPDTGSADLDLRFMFARGLESLRLPYRLEYGFRFDAAAGDLVVDVEVPSSAVMVRLVRDGAGVRERTYAEREGLATRYALHLAGVVAAVAFWAGPQVAQVTVNCWHGKGSAAGVDELAPLGGGLVRGPVMGEPACVASLQCDRAWLADHLADPAARAAFDDDPLAFMAAACAELGASGPACAAARFAVDADGHLDRVEPLRDIEEPRLHPADTAVQPDLDDRALEGRAAATLHASRICDLAIYENATRRKAGEEIADAFEEGGRDAALATVKDVHDRTENLLVRQACLRVQDGIESGALTDASRRQVVETLSDIYGLQAGLRNAYRTLQNDPAAACRQLVAMLAEVDERVVFADTATRRYRYFDSYASRVLYGMRCAEADDGRELRLCADEYYLCHYRLASVLSESLDHAEDAIAHARRCVELAPSVAASYLRLARCYFSVFDYLSEIDTLRDMLRIAWNPTDVGLALYWLGYAFCLVDKADVGMACYQSCTEFDPSLTEAAVTEAADFMRRKGDLPKSYSERQLAALLASERIDLAQVKRNVHDLLRAAGAAVDAGAWGLARNLLGATEPTLRDDALSPVEESLEE